MSTLASSSNSDVPAGTSSSVNSASTSNSILNEKTEPINDKDSEPLAGSSSSSSIPSSSAGPSKKTTKDDDDKKEDSMFECNICLDQAKDDAVVSMCGHLFCWPCLHQWLETRPTRQLCPVCKAAISKDKVIPIYGRGSTNQEDPRTKVPPRPAGQRVEPEPGTGFQGFGFADGGFHMSFGIGAFPFGFFTSSFNIGDNRPNAAQRGRPGWEEEQFLSKVFLWVAVLFITWLVLA